MPLIFDHAQQPRGGYRFKDPSSHEIRANSLKKLIAAIADYRMKNGFPPGNPAEELENLYRTEAPWLISKVGDTPAVEEDPVARWLMRVWRSGNQRFVESETTSDRMKVCLKCQFYKDPYVFSRDVVRRATILGGGKLKEMGVCEAQGWACGLAVLLERPLPPSSPEGCWIRQDERASASV